MWPLAFWPLCALAWMISAQETARMMAKKSQPKE